MESRRPGEEGERPAARPPPLALASAYNSPPPKHKHGGAFASFASASTSASASSSSSSSRPSSLRATGEGKKGRGPARRVVCIGDLHGNLSNAKRLWSNLERRLGRGGLMAAKVVFLGDYCDRGHDTKGMLDWLIERKELRAKQNAETVFICGNHDFAMAAYLGTEWLPAAPVPSDKDIDADTNPKRYASGYLTREIKGGMHYQGRRWGGSPTYNAEMTFKSYGVAFGYTEAHRSRFLAAVPLAHKRFLKSLAWVHDCEVAFGPKRLIAVHAGLYVDGDLESQLKGLKARDLFDSSLLEGAGRYYSMSSRGIVEEMHPSLEKKAYLVSGHHGWRSVSADGYRIICDKSGGIPSQPLEAVVLPSGEFVSDAVKPAIEDSPSVRMQIPRRTKD